MINFSRQRNTILEVLRSTDTHPTADWVYEECRKKMPNISLGTVYRNLNLLVEMGEAIKVKGAFEKDRFDGCVARHGHMVCSECGAITDINIAEGLDECIMQFINENNEYMEGYDITFSGLCKKCADKKNKTMA